MLRRRSEFLLLLWALLLPPATAATAPVAGEILVQWRAGGARAVAAAVAPELARARTRRLSHLGIDHLILPPGSDGEAVIARLRASGLVVHAEPNLRRRPYRRFRVGESDYQNQWAVGDIRLPSLQGGGAAVTVAVLDDGFALEHPALQGWIAVNGGEIPGNGVDDDGNDRVDDVQGWDFVDEDPDPRPTAAQLCDLGGVAGSHGTMVAGAAARVMAESGLPLRILPLRIGCDYSLAAELAAVDYVLENKERLGIRVVNLSYGGPAFSVFEQGAVERLAKAGILVVTAAGNFDLDNDYVPDYPSSIPLPQVLAVAASDRDGFLAPWSQYGAVSVDLAAPGVGVVVPQVGPSAEGLQYDWGRQDGTSFAAPIAAAAAALLWSLRPDADPLAVKGALLAGVRPLNNARQGLLATDGRLAVDAALAALLDPSPLAVVDGLTLTGPGLLDPALGDPGASGTARLSLRWYGDPGNQPQADLDGRPLTGRPGLEADLTLPEAAGRALLGLDFGGYRRHLPLEIGRLEADGAVLEADIRSDDQDDIRRFHLPVPARAGYDLLIEADVTDPEGVVDLALAKDGYPQLDYYAYCEGAVGQGVRTAYAPPEGAASLRLVRPAAGDYQLLVIAPPQAGPCAARYQGPRRFRLQARWVPSAAAGGGGGGGCSLTTRPAGVDPVLPALLLLALLALGRRWT